MSQPPQKGKTFPVMEKELKAPGLLDCQGKTSHTMAPFSHLLSTYVYFCMSVPEFLHVPMFQMTPPKNINNTLRKSTSTKKSNLQKYQYQHNKRHKTPNHRGSARKTLRKHHQHIPTQLLAPNDTHLTLQHTTPNHITSHPCPQKRH